MSCPSYQRCKIWVVGLLFYLIFFIKGINRTEYNLILNQEGEYCVPKDIQKLQWQSSSPIYTVDKKNNTLWLQNESRNVKQELDITKRITKDDISSDLLKIILHNDKTGATDNFSRLDYILEAANAMLMSERGIVAIPTGGGKSLILAILVEKIKGNILVIAPTLVIVQQLKNLLKKLKIDHKATVSTHLTAAKIEPDIIGEKPKYDCIIYDECHKISCQSYLKSLFRSETKNIYGLSASISKYGSCSAKFHIGPLLYELPYNVARELKSSINGIKYFHKFEFGSSKNEKIKLLKSKLGELECFMNMEIAKVGGSGYEREMIVKNIRARYVNMGFLLAEKSEERNNFVALILQAITKQGLLNITFLRTKECGRLITKIMPPKSTLFWCADGMYIYENANNEKLKKVDYEYVDTHFGKELNNILATSCLQMGVNLQFQHGTINSIMLLSGSTHNSLAQQVGRAVRCNPSSLPAKAHTIIDMLPLLNTNAENRVKDLSRYFSLNAESELLHKEDNWQETYLLDN